MKSLDKLYLQIGATWLVLGMVLGITMGIAEDFKFAPLHAHINLLGFACHALFGLAYRVWPALAGASLAVVQFWIFVISTPVMAIGLYFTLTGGPVLPTIIGSLGLLIGAGLFCTMVWRLP